MRYNLQTILTTTLLLSLFSCNSKSAEEEASLSGKFLEIFNTPDQETPELFSETQLFLDNNPDNPAAELVAYDVKVPLWTDQAVKKRYIFVPPDKEIELDKDKKQFNYPSGTVFIKMFSTESGNSPIETRVMSKKDDGSWHFATYVWESEDAKKNKFPRRVKAKDDQEYRVPSEKECKSCHDAENEHNPVIGFRPAQIDSFALSELLKFNASAEEIAATESIQDPKDETLSVEERVKAYMEVNCGICHRPDGAAYKDFALDLRVVTPTSESGLVSLKKVVPGDIENSVLWQKFIATEERMPPLSIREDPLAKELFKKWIEDWPKE